MSRIPDPLLRVRSPFIDSAASPVMEIREFLAASLSKTGLP
jgi:hypothetical protein